MITRNHKLRHNFFAIPGVKKAGHAVSNSVDQNSHTVRNGTPYISSLFMATSLKSHGIYQRLAVITIYLCPSMKLVLIKAAASYQN
jgi:hypothetical protein